MIALVIIIIAVSVIATAVVALSLTKTAGEADRRLREYSCLKKKDNSLKIGKTGR